MRAPRGNLGSAVDAAQADVPGLHSTVRVIPDEQPALPDSRGSVEGAGDLLPRGETQGSAAQPRGASLPHHQPGLDFSDSRVGRGRPGEDGCGVGRGEGERERDAEEVEILPLEEVTGHRAAELQEEVPEEDDRLDPLLENVSTLGHLALFAMLGVCIRYGLEVLWGPRCLHVTDDAEALFMDVPPNMFGSFLMGIVGYVSKRHIAAYSQPLAIGLSTGLCGSITTFASWNQRMMSILAYGYVARALSGYIVGTALAYYSFLVGIDTAHGISALIHRFNARQREKGLQEWTPRPEHYGRRWLSLIVTIVLCIICWTAASTAFAIETLPPRLREMALGCIVGPFGCWLRWYLSWLNGKGVGRDGRWKWLPVGTLAANLIAAGIEAVVSAVDADHNTLPGSLIVGGLQIGFMGCLSTVSSLMQEVHILITAKEDRWRAYVYIYVVTILPAIILGILFYCVPVWALGVADNGYNKVDPWDQQYVSSEFS